MKCSNSHCKTFFRIMVLEAICKLKFQRLSYYVGEESMSKHDGGKYTVIFFLSFVGCNGQKF